MNAIPEWSRTRRIFELGLPIMAGMSTYIAIELVDMLFVGMLGTTALASVGIAVFLAFLYLAFFGGVSVAVQTMTSRLVGQGEEEDLGRFLRTALVIVLIAVPPSSILIVWLAPTIMEIMTEDALVVETGYPYLRWMIASGIFFIIANAFMGFWNATNRPRLYLRVVILEALLNIPLNYMFIFGLGPVPAFGVTGAGIGTFITTVVGVAYHFLLAGQHAEGFYRGAVRQHLPVVIRVMIPAGAQQFLESLALTLMFRIVAMLGTLELAAYSVLVNLIGAVGMPAWGLGLAGATLVGQALGAEDKEDANRWAWDVVKVGTFLMILLGVPFWLFPEFILGLFIHEPETLAVALLPCRILGGMIAINGLGYLFASMLNGAGDVKRVMYVTFITQYLVLLPGAYLFGIRLEFGFLGIWLTHQIAFRALNSVILTSMWQKRRWARIKLWETVADNKSGIEKLP